MERTIKIIRLIRVDFDSMENREPIKEEQIALVAGVLGEPGYSVYDKVDAYLCAQKPFLYRSYDGEIYPQYKMLEETIMDEIPDVATSKQF